MRHKVPCGRLRRRGRSASYIGGNAVLHDGRDPALLRNRAYPSNTQPPSSSSSADDGCGTGGGRISNLSTLPNTAKLPKEKKSASRFVSGNVLVLEASTRSVPKMS